MKPKPIDFEKFDVEKYLQSRRIEYAEAGERNVAQGWVGIRCLFCDDSSTHLGINLSSKGWNCFRCGTGKKRSILFLIMHLDHVNYDQAVRTLKEYANTSLLEGDDDNDDHAEEKYRVLRYDFKLIDELQPLHRQYLESRNYNISPDKLYEKYKLKCIGYGEKSWSNRLYIPIIFQRQTLSYTARAVTKAKIPYKNAPSEKSVEDIRGLVYNYDSVKNVAIVVEGPGDVWNCGDGFVATLGTEYSLGQVFLLTRISKVFIMYDAEEKAQTQAQKLANEIAGSTSVEILSLSEGDPGELSEIDVKNLRNEIFGKWY